MGQSGTVWDINNSLGQCPIPTLSAGTSKTLLILCFLVTGADESNFGGTSFFIISSCRLEVSAKGLRPFFLLTYIKNK